MKTKLNRPTPSIETLKIGIVIGGLMLAISRFARRKKSSAKFQALGCAWTSSKPFQYASGCTDIPQFSCMTVGHFGRSDQYRACLPCHAMTCLSGAWNNSHPDFQAFLRELQDSAGIRDYRYFKIPDQWERDRQNARRRRKRALKR